MIINRKTLFGLTFCIMIVCCIITDNIGLSWIITIAILMSVYVSTCLIRHKKRINILEQECDPIAFIEATEKQMSIMEKKPKYITYLNIDKAVGLIALGECQQAKDILTSIDKSYLSERNGTLITYTIDLICCLHELGEFKEAEELFESQMPILSPINKRIRQSVNLLIADRLFYKNKFEESEEIYKKVLNEKITKSRKLSIIYSLAKINEHKGDIEKAKKQYKEVANNGNKLWIAKQAKDNLEKDS